MSRPRAKSKKRPVPKPRKKSVAAFVKEWYMMPGWGANWMRRDLLALLREARWQEGKRLFDHWEPCPACKWKDR